VNRDTWTLSTDHVDLRRPTVEPRVVTIDAAPQRLTLDLARTAIVVVDLQNDFCHPDGWLASIGVDVSGASSPVEPLQETLPVLRAAGAQVIWLNWGNREDLANLPPGVRHVYDADGNSTGIGDSLPNGSAVLTEGSWAAALVDELVPEPEDVQVSKYRMSGFFDTPLDSILRRMRVDTVLFAGVNTDQCVLATLSDAACLGYDVVLVEDLCATTSPQFCTDATIYNVRQVFGFTTTSAQLRAAL